MTEPTPSRAEEPGDDPATDEPSRDEPTVDDSAPDVPTAAETAEALEPIGPAPSLRRRRRERRSRAGSARRWWLVAPAVAVLALVTLWPLGRAIVSSLYRSSLTTPGADSFVGIDNYVAVLASRQWWLAVAATLALVGTVVLLQLLLASLLAAALRRVTVAVPLTRALLLVPFALLAVVTATVWREGLTTGFGPAWFGYDGDGQAATYAAIMATEVWRGTGITTLILLVGLARVGPSLLESAVADGATARQRLTRVVWPAAGPAVAVAVVYRSLDALRAFEAPLIADGATRTRTAPLLVWDTTFEAFEIGLGAAASVLLLVLAALLGTVLALALRMRRVV